MTGDEVYVKEFPSQLTLQTSVNATFCATMFALVAALWQYTAATTLAFLVDSLGDGIIKASVGSTSVSLVWAGCALLLVEACGSFVVVKSSISDLDLEQDRGQENIDASFLVLEIWFALHVSGADPPKLAM